MDSSTVKEMVFAIARVEESSRVEHHLIARAASAATLPSPITFILTSHLFIFSTVRHIKETVFQGFGLEAMLICMQVVQKAPL